MLDSCADPDEFAARIGAAFGAGAAADWRRLWRRAARVWDASWRHILRVHVDSPLRPGPAGLAAAATWPRSRPGRTLRGLGRRHLRDPRLRMLLDRYATYTGADPRRAPAALVAIPYAELPFGGWYLRGGLGTLADALLARCLRPRRGACRPAPTVDPDRRRRRPGARGTPRRRARRCRADVVVANADALHVYRDLLPDAAPAGRGWPTAASPASCCCSASRGATPGLAHHTVFFPRDYDAEFDAVFGDPGAAYGPGRRPTRRCSSPWPTTRWSGRPGTRRGSCWSTRPGTARAGAVDWRRPGLADAYADRILDVLAARGRGRARPAAVPRDPHAGRPGRGDRRAGRLDLRHAPRAGLLRPANRGPVDGLFLVGGSAHPGGGLPLVTLSAQIVAAEIGPAW